MSKYDVHPSIKLRNDMRKFVTRYMMDLVENSSLIDVRKGQSDNLREYIFSIVDKSIYLKGIGGLVVSYNPDLSETDKYLKRGLRVFKKSIRDKLEESLSLLPIDTEPDYDLMN